LHHPRWEQRRASLRYNFLLVPLTSFREAIPILDVRDIDRAIAYYVERLGFEVAFRCEDNPKNYAGVSRGCVHLDMQWQHEDHLSRLEILTFG
jgi:hypothetical protein